MLLSRFNEISRYINLPPSLGSSLFMGGGGGQTFQLSRILRETRAFDIFLTLTRINTFFSRKSEKIGSDPTFVLTLLFASKYSYLAESIAIK